MFTALHQEVNKPANGWTVSPRKFFGRIFMGGVVFYFLPGLLFPALSSFNVITWFAPKNVIVANLVCSILSVSKLWLTVVVWNCIWTWFIPGNF
jgi:hypothetical protein